MAQEIFLTNWVISGFILPFLLIFFIVFALLEKTGIFGTEQKQLNSLIAFVIALIFVIATSPKVIVSNLILFLSVAIVIIFIGLLLWGFVSGEVTFSSNYAKIIAGIVIFISLFLAVLYSAGFNDEFFNFWKGQNFTGFFWTNLFFIIVIAAAIAVAIKYSGGSSS